MKKNLKIIIIVFGLVGAGVCGFLFLPKLFSPEPADMVKARKVVDAAETFYLKHFTLESVKKCVIEVDKTRSTKDILYLKIFDKPWAILGWKPEYNSPKNSKDKAIAVSLATQANYTNFAKEVSKASEFKQIKVAYYTKEANNTLSYFAKNIMVCGCGWDRQITDGSWNFSEAKTEVYLPDSKTYDCEFFNIKDWGGTANTQASNDLKNDKQTLEKIDPYWAKQIIGFRYSITHIPQQTTGMIFAVIISLILFLIYLLPSWIAFLRGHEKAWQIFVINFCFGIWIIPWFTSLSHALGPTGSGFKGFKKGNKGNTKKCPFCGEEILQIAVKCKHCREFLNKPGERSAQSR